jgi:uncharacterized protein (TIGR03437 family)
MRTTVTTRTVTAMTRRAVLITLPIAALLTAIPGFGYIRQILPGMPSVPLVRVDNTGIQFYLNSQIVPGMPSPVSGSSVTVITAGSNPQAAVHAALATWNAVGTANVSFLPLKSTTAVINPNDFQHTIAVGSTASDLSVVGGALAVTVDSAAPQSANAGPNGTLLACTANCTYPAGGIYDSDIIINPEYTFTTIGEADHDFQSVILHELGHSLGANHTGLLGASMYQFPTNRFLTSDDLAFVNSAYPPASGAVALGTISGTVKTSAGATVPLALLTAANPSAGVSVGGVSNPDGTYSIQVPPGSYQLYAEPLSGVISINIYQSSEYPGVTAGTGFQTTLFSGGVTVAANATATANIVVNGGTSSLTTPVVAVTAVNALPPTAVSGGPVVVPSGGSVDLVLSGAGFNSTLSASNFNILAQGVTIQSGSTSVRVDNSELFNGFPLLRVTLNVAATSTPTLGSFIVTSGTSTLSFSGALVIVPPTPTFIAAGVISSAPYPGIPGAVSPGGIYTIYSLPNSPNLGPGGADPTKYVSNGPYDAYGYLPTILAGVSVTFDGVPAPMFLSWGYQLTLQVPYEVAGKTSTQVVVNNMGSVSAPVTVPVQPVQLSIYTRNQAGTGPASAYNLANGVYTLNSQQNPAPAGSYVELYGTGVGKLSSSLVTGLGQGAPAVVGNYTYSMGGSPTAPVHYGALIAGLLGFAQWDLQIPSGIVPVGTTAAVPVVITDVASGAQTPSGITIWVSN